MKLFGKSRDMQKTRVLILSANGTQALPIAESLHNHRMEIHGFFRKKLSYGYASRFFYKKTIIKYKSDDEYIQQVIDYVEDNRIDVIFPMGDVVAGLVSKYQERLNKYVHFVTPKYQSFCEGYDKNKLMKNCQKCNIPHPRTFDLSAHSIKEIDDTIFPALIKPNITTGGRGMTLVRSKKELEMSIESIRKQYGDCHLQEFIEAGGKQVKAQLFVDKHGNLLCSSVMHKQRYYPEKGGSSCCNTTIIDDKVVENCLTILRAIKWEGMADFDLIEDPKDGILKIMEINPRVPACIKSAIKSGADYAELYVDYALGNNVKIYCSEPGYTLRHLGFDFLWFFKSNNRFKTKPSWFLFFGKKIYYQDFSIKDPLPFIYGCLENLIKMLDPSFRKSKSGTTR